MSRNKFALTGFEKRVIEAVEKILAYSFKDKYKLLEALTHRSYFNNLKKLGRVPYNYERLEFLGDAVLEIVVSEYIFRRFPNLSEGEMSRLRAALVNTQILSHIATQKGLDKFIIMGKGERLDKGETKPHILASVFEAIVGAMYLDSGLRNVRGLVTKWVLEPYATKFYDEKTYIDSKTLLQEYTQRNFGVLPEYETESIEGAEHSRIYNVCVRIHGKVVGRGSGPSVKRAQMAAAARALERLQKNKMTQ